ncbi:MAG TPA: elongation factor G [Myxococcota bacterium]|nr:elongation factor G [Myxococcota bacterium]
MANPTPKKSTMAHVRNIGIMAHIDAGKTTVSERLLFVSGREHKIGEVHDGETTMDWMVQERERGITITSAVTTFNWEVEPKNAPLPAGSTVVPLPAKAEMHLIDTPGHVDFTIEVSRSLRVLDGAVTVFDGVHGVEPQTETVWRQADRYRVPRIGFINKMDRIGADYWRSFHSMEERFGEHVAPAALPIGTENRHRGIVEVIERRAWVWTDPDDPRSYSIEDVPADMVDDVEKARSILLERVAIADDDFAMAWLEDPESVDVATIHAAIRKATIHNKLVPVLCGAALRNKGVQPLLNAIVLWLPSPDDVPEVEGVHPTTREPEKRPHDPKGPLAGLAFKVAMMGDDGRRLVFVRLYSGTLTAGAEILNPAKGIKEKVSRIFMMHANQRERKDSVGAGNIFGVLGLKHTKTGDTICDPNKPILLEQIDAYEPVISQSIEPETTRDRDKMLETLGKLADEDPTFRWREDQQTGQTIISGMGELHLDVLTDRVRREFDVPVRIGKPQVVYRETITSSAVEEEIFERQAEGDILYGQVAVRVKPRERGTGNLVEWSFPREDNGVMPVLPWFTADVKNKVQSAIENQLGSGVLSGDPLEDVHVVIAHVGWREGTNKTVGYSIAASGALRKALQNANPARLAPIANVEVATPPEYTGDIIGSLNQRRGRIENMEEISPQVSHIKAQVPIERMFGYSTELRSMSQGRASFQMTFSHYDIA